MFGSTSSGPECPTTPLQMGFKFHVSQRVKNGVEFSRFDGSVFSLIVPDCHLVDALHPRSLFLWTLGKNRTNLWKITGIASSVSTAAHLNTVPGSLVPTSRLSLPTCTPPTMSRLFLLMRNQALESCQSKPCSQWHQFCQTPKLGKFGQWPRIGGRYLADGKQNQHNSPYLQNKKTQKKLSKRTIGQKKNWPE